MRIASRLLLRIALLAATLAWAAFVFTNTIGDPGRGQRIADAVLDDADARAEITAPITDAVLELGGLPPEQATTVDAVVDQVLRDPAGAQAFIEPFATSWARLLGEEVPGPTEFDLTTILGDLDEAIAALDLSAFTGSEEELIVPSVPLPRAELEWMRSVRRTIRSAILPLAVAGAGFAAAAFATGDRRRVLRRVGVWAASAGMLWVVIPPLINWATRSWAPGADSVVAISVAEATDGLRMPALILVVAGLATFAGSFVVPPRPAEVAGATGAFDPMPGTENGAATTFVDPEPPYQPVPQPAAPTELPVAPHAATIAPADEAAVATAAVAPTEVVGDAIAERAPESADAHLWAPTGVEAVDGVEEPPGDDDASVWDFYSR